LYAVMLAVALSSGMSSFLLHAVSMHRAANAAAIAWNAFDMFMALSEN